MRRYYAFVLLYRYFGIGCVAGSLLMNVLLDLGYPDVVRAKRFIMDAVYGVGFAVQRFPAGAAGVLLILSAGLARLCLARRARFWMSLVVMAAGGLYAGLTVIFVRGMV